MSKDFPDLSRNWVHESRRGGLQMCNLCELCALDANGAASKEERGRCVVFSVQV